MKAKKIIVMLIAMISLMCFGLSFNKIEAATTTANYSIKTGLTGDGSELTDSTDFKNLISIDANGYDIISSYSNQSRVYKGKYDSLKLGSGSAIGKFTINLNDTYIIKNVTIGIAKYGSDTGSVKLTVGTENTVSKQPSNAINEDKTKNTETLSYSSETGHETNKIVISTSEKRAYVTSISITYSQKAVKLKEAIDIKYDNLTKTLTWGSVTNADSYTVNLYQNNSLVSSLSSTTNTLVLPTSTTVGTYSVKIIANPVSGSTEFTSSNESEALTIEVLSDISIALAKVDAKMSLAYTYTKTTEYSGNVSTKYAKITSVDELHDGIEVYLVGSNAKGTEHRISIGRENTNTYLSTETVNIDSNGYLTLSNNATPVTLNVSGNGYTLKLGNQYIGSTTAKSITFTSTSTVWNISFDSKDDNKAIIKISDTLVLQYNSGSPRFTTYSGTLENISLYKKVEIQELTTTYSNVEVVLRCAINKTQADALSQYTTYGIFVRQGTQVRCYGSEESIKIHVDEVNGLYYVTISLGDVLNNLSRATDKFEVGAYLVDENSDYYYSTNTKVYSVADMIKTYYGDNDTKEQVEDLYNYLYDNGCYNAN